MSRTAIISIYLWTLATLLVPSAFAQFDPGSGKQITDISPPDVIHWQPAGGQVYLDDVIEVGVRLFTEMDFTLYIDKVKFEATGFELARMEAPPTSKLLDPISVAEVDVYTGGDFMLFFRSVESFEGEQFELKITYLGCTTRICLFPYTETVSVPVFKAKKNSPLSSDEKSSFVSDETSSDATLSAGKGEPIGSFEERWADKVAKGEFSIWMLIVIVFLGGMATNLTPCVAPMLPITIRVLSNQQMKPMVSSSLYALGIMVTYSTIGSMAVYSGSAFGTFMQSSGVNLFFAAVMGFLGLSMLGFGDFSKLQSIGARFGSGKPSAKNTFFMGAGAGLVAAPCTGPVLGALLTFSAGQQNPTQGMLLMSIYSFGFALPYVFLGGMAGKASAVRVSPYVQLFIKVAFGAVMFGLCFYYLRVPLYTFVKIIRPFYGQIAIAGLISGSLFGIVWLLKKQWHNNKYVMASVAFVLGVGLFGGSQWLTQSTSSELTWYKTKAEAFAAAADQNKPILMDNWAEWCEACKKMDVTTFKDPRVVEELSTSWIVLKLDLTEGTEAHDAHMEEYGIVGLPTLVMLTPDGATANAKNIIGYVSGEGLLAKLQEFNGN